MPDDLVPPPVDRRTSLRHAANIPAAILSADWSVFAVVEDISDSGVLFLTSEEIAVGTRVNVYILLGSEVRPPVRALATVVRSQPREAGGSFWTHQVAVHCEQRVGPWDQALAEVVARQADLRRTDE
jgi:hypothetical protein